MGRTPAGETRERVFRFVRRRLLAGRPPTVREVQEALGFRAVQTAQEHLEALVEEGRLVKSPGRARGYRLPGGDEATSMVPLLGRVAAGALAEAIEDPEGYVPIRSGLRPEGLFALRVRGESMRDAGILPDDVVIVRRQPRAESGEIVVALVDGEATVKRLKLRRRRIELHPENPDFPVIVPRKEDVRILGKVIELRRYLED
ncbi:MAG: transcriptional repressor LexA [Acidobacteriota bacterium]|jgi:repressor LexA